MFPGVAKRLHEKSTRWRRGHDWRARAMSRQYTSPVSTMVKDWRFGDCCITAASRCAPDGPMWGARGKLDMSIEARVKLAAFASSSVSITARRSLSGSPGMWSGDAING